MPTLKLVRILGTGLVLSGISAFAVLAQTTSPSSPTTPPTTPPPASKPSATPTPPAAKPSTPTRPTDKSATAPAKTNPLIGLAVFSSDGSKLGSVQSVKTDPDGKVKAIHFKSGGFLGFGGKMVEIPEGKFTKTGDNIQLGMTSDEVSKLPEYKDQS
jgi:sporulation protein YlmC with PRC-barrel domain